MSAARKQRETVSAVRCVSPAVYILGLTLLDTIESDEGPFAVRERYPEIVERRDSPHSSRGDIGKPNQSPTHDDSTRWIDRLVPHRNIVVPQFDHTESEL